MFCGILWNEFKRLKLINWPVESLIKLAKICHKLTLWMTKALILWSPDSTWAWLETFSVFLWIIMSYTSSVYSRQTRTDRRLRVFLLFVCVWHNIFARIWSWAHSGSVMNNSNCSVTRRLCAFANWHLLPRTSHDTTAVSTCSLGHHISADNACFWSVPLTFSKWSHHITADCYLLRSDTHSAI